MKPFPITAHCLFSFYAFYCWLTQRGTCEVLSWHCWHPVWFYHMCLGWNVCWFSFALYIDVYKWLVWSLFLFSYAPVLRKDFVKQIIRQMMLQNPSNIHGHWVDWSTGLWSLLRVIKTKIKWDWRQTGSTWEIRFWITRLTANVCNYSRDGAGESVYNIMKDQFRNDPLSNVLIQLYRYLKASVRFHMVDQPTSITLITQCH